MELKTREEIPQKYKWQLEDIFESNELWEKTFLEIQNQIPGLSKNKNQIKQTTAQKSEVLLQTLEQHSQIELCFERLVVFSLMRKDQDNANPIYQAMSDRAMSLGVELDAALSYVVPEILEISEKDLQEICEKKEFENYKFTLQDILRTRKHTLAKELEELLSQSGEIAAAPKKIYQMLDNADIKFGYIKIEDEKSGKLTKKTNEKVELTHGNFITYMQSKNQTVRKNAFQKLYKTYKGFENTYAATLGSSNKKDVFFAKARKYESALEQALSDENVPKQVYTNLIDSTHKNLPLLHKYFELRKKVMNLEKLHLYDVYTPIGEAEMDIPYEKAQEILLEAFAPLGEEYCETIKQAFSNNWIDVYENKNKTSGAYCWGAYGTHPYVLMSYTNDIDSLFTLAHELGHAMHSFYSDKTQPYPNAQYKIFVAEVASTFNEALLMDYLLKTQTDNNVIIRLLNYYLEQFRTTVFRQVMFAEFEKITHDMVENGESLTSENLCKKYLELNKLYFGTQVVIDDEIEMEWARISHFYNAFYVYKYATGFSAAVALSKGVLAKKPQAKQNYMEFLKSGGSDYPIELLKRAGVDLTQKQAVDDALKVFEETIERFENVLGAQNV